MHIFSKFEENIFFIELFVKRFQLQHFLQYIKYLPKDFEIFLLIQMNNRIS